MPDHKSPAKGAALPMPDFDDANRVAEKLCNRFDGAPVTVTPRRERGDIHFTVAGRCFVMNRARAA